uniref:EF-hand domain-containing protein n=1 Tax=Ananas comosus var. bracteatus TaxID=296719 RepID=A0A6V7QJE7_ANACO|nr:unnamed protein product [Ananas comosus var. bracteatus]
MAWRSKSSPLPLPLLLLFLVSLLLPIAIRGAEARSISRPVALGSDPSLSDGIDTPHSYSRSGPSLSSASSLGARDRGVLELRRRVASKRRDVLVRGVRDAPRDPGAGIVGGLFLPILGALPDAMLILETAQSQVLIGMGLLSGSTVMLLTLLWGSCIVVGKCDLSENLTSVDSQDTKGFNLFGSGVTTDLQTSYAARIMAISILPFIIVQLPKIFKFPSGQRLTVLLSLIVAVALVLSYCLYQIFQPWIQRRRLAYAKHKHVISGILRHAQMATLGRLLYDDGTPNVSIIQKLFHKIDLDENGLISRAELRAFIIGIQFEEIDLDRDDAVDKVMDDFDTSGNDIIEEEEFIRGICNWLEEAKRSITYSGAYSKRFLQNFHMKTRDEHNLLLDKGDEVVENVDNPTWTCFKAILLVLLELLWQPYLRIHLSTLLAIFRLQRKEATYFFPHILRDIWWGNDEQHALLGRVLGLVYLRHLTWDFSSEVLIILIVCVVMGLFTSFRTTFPLWTCFVAYLLYPLSLVIVYVLDFVFGWS